MPWKKRREMCLHADRTHTRPAAAMGQRERLVQIDVADIGAVVAGPRQSDLRVQVRPVEVNLPAMRVNEVADRANPLLKSTTPKTRRFQHAVPYLSFISRCRGRINSHPVSILSGDSYLTARSEQGPLRHLMQLIDLAA